MTDQDTLAITNIRAYGYSGALPPENQLGQWFQVDLCLQLDLAIAGASDSLADTHDYSQTIAAVQQVIQQRAYRLVETLASEVAKTVLQADERLQTVTVTLTKLSPPVPAFAGTIAVQICRDRSLLTTPSPPPLPNVGAC